MNRSFGPYVVEQELARGGMGVVYAVRHRETGVRYALKTLLPLAGLLREDAARFQREVDLLSRLDHPGIVQVHSAGVEAGCPYLVQAFLPGGSLQERLKRDGPLPPAEAVALVADLADALDDAHTHGVLHRDLKPHNVLHDEHGRAVLVDFGLGRDLAAESQRLTETGQVMGTPGYMAPEQVQGGRQDDPRTDVYGLGALLFALLTGQPPFRGSSLAILARIVHDSAPDVTTLAPQVPPGLAAAVARCLAKRPGDRFASAAELAQVLRAGESPRRREGSGWLGAAAALGGAAVLLTLVLASARTEPTPSVAVTPTRSATPSPAPSPSPAAEPDPGWARVVLLVADDPTRALEAAQERRGAPAPRDRRGLEAALEIKIERLRSKLQAVELRRLPKLEHLTAWLDCLELGRRATIDPTPAWVAGLDEVPTRLQRNAEGQALALRLGKTLRGRDAPKLAWPLMLYARRLPVKQRLVLLQVCLDLIRDVPPTPAFLRAHLAIATELSGQHGPYVGDASSYAKPLLAHARRLLREARPTPLQRGALHAVCARALLQHGEPAAAYAQAAEGVERKDTRSVALQAIAAARIRRLPVARRRALEYLRTPGVKLGSTLGNMTMALAWDGRGTPEVPHAALQPLLSALCEDRSMYHSWGVRCAALWLELDEPDRARERLAKAVQASRDAAPGSCPCASVHPQLQALPLDVSDPRPLQQLVDALDERRRPDGHP